MLESGRYRNRASGLVESDTFMALRFQLEYWKDGAWLVGRLPEVPGVFSQGATLDELELNIRDAYRMMRDEQNLDLPASFVTTKEIEVQA